MQCLPGAANFSNRVQPSGLPTTNSNTSAHHDHHRRIIQRYRRGPEKSGFLVSGRSEMDRAALQVCRPLDLQGGGMTNQTIYGVPRELLLDIEYWLKHMESEKSVAGRCSALKELRALLETKPCAHKWTDDGGFLLACTACGEQEDYEQALQLAFELGGTDDGAYHLEADELVQVIQRYAEQPAPVAHTMKSVMTAICRIDGFPMLTSNECHALAQKLNEQAP